jgi:hypothetical protein
MGEMCVSIRNKKLGPNCFSFHRYESSCARWLCEKEISFDVGFVCCYCCWLAVPFPFIRRVTVTAPPKHGNLFKFHIVFASGNRFRFFPLFISYFSIRVFDFSNGELWPANVGAWNFCFSVLLTVLKWKLSLSIMRWRRNVKDLLVLFISFGFETILRSASATIAQRWDVGRFFPSQRLQSSQWCQRKLTVEIFTVVEFIGSCLKKSKQKVKTCCNNHRLYGIIPRADWS